MYCYSILRLRGFKKKGGGEIKYFGQFGYNGIYLTYAVKNISYFRAKEITQDTSTRFTTSIQNVKSFDLNMSDEASPSNSLVDSILSEYAACQIVTTYYVNGSKEKQIKVDLLQGIDFKSMLATNQFTAFNQLIAKYLLAFPSLIDFMEQNNEEWRNSNLSTTAPFKAIFSYHTNSTGNLIIQTRDFSEIASSVGGGIGCNYRQDTEIIYDAQNKISKW